MKIIVGLGNPGKEYEGSRHNAGFMFLDEFVKHSQVILENDSADFRLEKKFSAEILEAKINGTKLILVKPQTFMNLSGEAVNKIISYYKAELSDLIVASDDLDLPVGILRVRHEGSSGGQKGLQSIIDHISDDKFTRFRIGIGEETGKVATQDVNNYVLGKIGKRALPIITETISEGVSYLIEHLKDNKEIVAHTIEVNRET